MLQPLVHQAAKILAAGRSQAMRWPLEFHFDVAEVFIRHESAAGNMVPSRKSTEWQALLDGVAQNVEDSLLIERRQTEARREPLRVGKSKPALDVR